MHQDGSGVSIKLLLFFSTFISILLLLGSVQRLAQLLLWHIPFLDAWVCKARRCMGMVEPTTGRNLFLLQAQKRAICARDRRGKEGGESASSDI
jgi:hypothetical protein